MKKKLSAALIASLILIMTVLTTGCSGTVGYGVESAGSIGKAVSGTAVTAPAGNAAVIAAAAISDLFTTRDLNQTADLTDATALTVSDGETVNISETGVYILTGSAKNACVVVEAGDDDKVQLVLDGVSIVNTDQPCILIENADKVLVFEKGTLLQEGTHRELKEKLPLYRDLVKGDR